MKKREKEGKKYIVGIKINSENGEKNGVAEKGFTKHSKSIKLGLTLFK